MKRIAYFTCMSRQLAISAAFSVFALAAFTLSVTPDRHIRPEETATGAKIEASAPALGRSIPAVPLFGG